MPYKYKGKEKEYMKEYFIKNRKKLLIRFRKYREENPEIRKQSYQKNREKELKNHNKWLKNNPEYNKLWYQKNREKVTKRSMEYRNNKYRTNLKSKLNYMMGNKIYVALKNNKNGRHWEDLVGYTMVDLKKHLESTMPKGYTWNDFLSGELHIDHIIPIRAFEFETSEDKEFKDCWNLENLRLLPKEKNLKKSYKITNPILLGLLLNYKKEVMANV